MFAVALTPSAPLGRPGFLVWAGASDGRPAPSSEEEVSASAACSLSDQRGLVVSPAPERTARQNKGEKVERLACDRALTPGFAVPDVAHGLLINVEVKRNVACQAGARNECLILARSRRASRVDLLNLFCLESGVFETTRHCCFAKGCASRTRKGKVRGTL